MSGADAFGQALLGIDGHGQLIAADTHRAHPVAWWAPVQGLCFSAHTRGPIAAPLDARLDGDRPEPLDGRRDWAVPRIDELQWLAQRGGVPHGRSALSHLHDAESITWCWSSTPCAWSDQLVWGMDPLAGTLQYRPRSALGHVVAVLRDWQPAAQRAPRAGGLRTPALVPLSQPIDGPWHVEGSGLAYWLLDRHRHLPQTECERACRALELDGHRDWRLARAEELALLVDRTHADPATAAADRLPSAWYWCSQPQGWEQAGVGLYVDLADGYLGCHERDYGGLALAVRALA